MAQAVFIYALRVFLRLPIPGDASLATQRCPGWLVAVDTIGSNGLSSCPSRARPLSERTAQLGADCNSTFDLVLLDLDRNRQQSDPGLRANPLVYGIEGQPHSFVDVAITCPTLHTILAGTQFRRGKTVQ